MLLKRLNEVVLARMLIGLKPGQTYKLWCAGAPAFYAEFERREPWSGVTGTCEAAPSYWFVNTRRNQGDPCTSKSVFRGLERDYRKMWGIMCDCDE